MSSLNHIFCNLVTQYSYGKSDFLKLLQHFQKILTRKFDENTNVPNIYYEYPIL